MRTANSFQRTVPTERVVEFEMRCRNSTAPTHLAQLLTAILDTGWLVDYQPSICGTVLDRLFRISVWEGTLCLRSCTASQSAHTGISGSPEWPQRPAATRHEAVRNTGEATHEPGSPCA